MSIRVILAILRRYFISITCHLSVCSKMRFHILAKWEIYSSIHCQFCFRVDYISVYKFFLQRVIQFSCSHDSVVDFLFCVPALFITAPRYFMLSSCSTVLPFILILILFFWLDITITFVLSALIWSWYSSRDFAHISIVWCKLVSLLAYLQIYTHL